MKVSIDVATEEVNKWLDYKKVNEKKREAYKDNIDALVQGVCDGILILNEDNTFTHNLQFPIEGEMPIHKLDYKPRLKMSTVHNHLQGVKPSDGDGRVCAYIAALTSKPKAVVKDLDTEDYSIGQSIAIFFL
jgi:hypothetical protein